MKPLLLLLALTVALCGQDDLTPRERMRLDRIAKLEQRPAALEIKSVASGPVAASVSASSAPQAPGPLSVPESIAPGTTINVNLEVLRL